MRIVSSRFWKVAVRAPATERFLSTLLPRNKLNVGPPVQDWPLLNVTGTKAAVMAAWTWAMVQYGLRSIVASPAAMALSVCAEV